MEAQGYLCPKNIAVRITYLGDLRGLIRADVLGVVSTYEPPSRLGFRRICRARTAQKSRTARAACTTCPSWAEVQQHLLRRDRNAIADHDAGHDCVLLPEVASAGLMVVHVAPQVQATVVRKLVFVRAARFVLLRQLLQRFVALHPVVQAEGHLVGAASQTVGSSGFGGSMLGTGFVAPMP